MDYEKLLPNRTSSDLGEMLPEQRFERPTRTTSKRLLHYGYLTLLLMSFCLNGLYIWDRSQRSHEASCKASHETTKEISISPEKSEDDWPKGLNLGEAPFTGEDISPYAEIPRDQLKPLVEHTSYHNPENWTHAHEMWKAIDIDWAIIALPDEFVEKKHLLTSQRFPWDQSKGIYTLHGMHNLHCLKVLYMAFKEFQANEEQTIGWEHLSHCFDSLRQQIMCDADDTPRASYAGQEGISGIGQARKCRNWDMYEAFARKNTACYKRPNKPNPAIPDIEHYKHCPPGTNYVIKNHTLNGVDFDDEAAKDP